MAIKKKQPVSKKNEVTPKVEEVKEEVLVIDEVVEEVEDELTEAINTPLLSDTGDEFPDDTLVAEEPETVEVTEEVDDFVAEEPAEEAEPEVVLVENTNKPLEPKKVRVRLKANHKCNIGGEWYNFIKGGVYSVPDNVREILSRADLLLPL